MSTEQLPIVLALDGMEPRACMDLCRAVGWRIYGVKIHDMFDQLNCEAITWLKQAGAKRVWVDYKLHDIPATVAKRAAALRDAGADIITVHASGGEAMIRAAVENGPPEVYAVTVLTSLGVRDSIHIFGDSPPVKVLQLARFAAKAGAQGVVCSPREVAALNVLSELTKLKFVVPGVRSPGKDTHDQARVATPAQAIADGASLLVIGRQVTGSDDPEAELQKIADELKGEQKTEES